MPKHLLKLLMNLLIVPAGTASAATCTWQSAITANWIDPLQWSDCALGSGVVVGTPGPADTAILPSGTGSAQLTSNVTVANLQLQPGAEIGATGALANRILLVSGQATLNAARLVTAPGADSPTMTLSVPAGATLQLSGDVLLDRAHIDLQGQADWQGGVAARLRLANSGDYVSTGITTVQHAFTIEYLSSNTEISNDGTFVVAPSGSVQLVRTASSGGGFNGAGVLDLDHASFNSGALVLNLSHLILRDGQYFGPVMGVTISTLLEGTGTINGRLVLGSGARLDINPFNGQPFGVLSVAGAMVANPGATYVFDVAGSTPTERDQLLVSGSFQTSDWIIEPRLQNGFAPVLDDSVQAIDYGSRIAGSSVLRIDSSYGLDWWAEFTTSELNLRLVPRLMLGDVAISEGQSGSQTLQFQARLSAPTTRNVAFSYRSQDGTANSTVSPLDYTTVNTIAQIPAGQLATSLAVTIQGDMLPEGDEAFALEVIQGTLTNASFGNGQILAYRAEGLIRDDDQPDRDSVILVGKDVSTSASGGSSYLARYQRDGNLIDRWRTLTSVGSGNAVTGMCVATNGDVLITRFSASQGPLRFTVNGAVRSVLNFPNIGNDESCISDTSGNFWIGEATLPNTTPTTFSLRQLAGDGRPLQTLSLPVGPRGTDWIAAAADGCTLLYTSEGSKIMRYDLCTQTALADFATGLEAPCFGLTQRSNGEWLQVCRHRLYRLDANGVVLQTYPRTDFGETDPAGLFALALDPDNESFWVGGAASGVVYRVSMAGTLISSFPTAPGGVSGLAIVRGQYLHSDGFE